MFHGRLALIGTNGVPAVARQYIEIISDADDIENGRIGAVGYLLNECRTDAKGYNTTHPEHFRKIKYGYIAKKAMDVPESKKNPQHKSVLGV